MHSINQNILVVTKRQTLEIEITITVNTENKEKLYVWRVLSNSYFISKSIL